MCFRETSEYSVDARRFPVLCSVPRGERWRQPRAGQERPSPSSSTFSFPCSLSSWGSQGPRRAAVTGLGIITLNVPGKLRHNEVQYMHWGRLGSQTGEEVLGE